MYKKYAELGEVLANRVSFTIFSLIVSAFAVMKLFLYPTVPIGAPRYFVLLTAQVEKLRRQILFYVF